MIIRKPYVFFIKMFKPFHILISLILIHLIYITNRMLGFFTEYIYSTENVVGQSLKTTIGSAFIFVIPILVVLFCFVFLFVLFRKNKPVTFYIINIVVFIAILIINVYVNNFLGIMEENIVSIKLTKLSHDLILINMIVEIIAFILFLIRGLGINFKKFDFDSDINKIDISDSDREEIEVSIGIDLDEKKRKRKKQFRQIKYFYKEHKFLINIIITVILILLVAIVFIINGNKYSKEKTIYNIGRFSLIVNNTYLVEEDYTGNKISENYLLVVDASLKSSSNNVSLYLKDFNLDTDEVNFKTKNNYSTKVIDIGKPYEENVLTNQFENYIFIFEVPIKFLESNFYFSYNNSGEILNIKLNPKELVSKNINISNKVGEEQDFSEALGNIKFNINDFEIKNKFVLEYEFCAEKNDCLQSKEYIKASINENFDKNVLRLNVSYVNESNLDMSNFYKFFSSFGEIHYKINDTWYSQKTKFEEIKSKRTKTNNVYIGVNSEIANAESIKLIFNVRDSKYEYILK